MLSQILEVGGCGSVDGYYPYLGEIAFRLLKPALSPLQLFRVGGFEEEVEPALQDLDAPLILSFLDHLETERSCCPRTRNLRLTAIRSFMRYVSVRDPASMAVC